MMSAMESWKGSDEEDWSDGAASRRRWFVLHVKPRTEKKTALYLAGYGCFHHLPLYVKVTKVQRRKVRRELPLFPGYVFARLSADERLKILRTNLLVRTILIPNPRQTIHELRQIAHASRANPLFYPVKRVFKEGELVRVRTGPFRGTEGYVKRADARTTLCLNVEILGAAVEVNISPADVERL